MNTRTMGWLCWAMVMGLVMACANPPPEAPMGSQTRVWLELQRAGSEAGESRGTVAEAEERGERRYLESFSTPLPAPPEMPTE